MATVSSLHSPAPVSSPQPDVLRIGVEAFKPLGSPGLSAPGRFVVDSVRTECLCMLVGTITVNEIGEHDSACGALPKHPPKTVSVRAGSTGAQSS